MGLTIGFPKDTIDNSFLTEVRAQWHEAIQARRDAEAAGDGWLAELMTVRLEDLRELVARSGLLAGLERQTAEAA